MARKTFDDFIEIDLHGAVDDWMKEYEALIPKGREDTMKYALRELISKGVLLHQKFEKENKYCTRSIIL